MFYIHAVALLTRCSTPAACSSCARSPPTAASRARPTRSATRPSAGLQQLGALERETGRALVERHGRGIRLTDAARLLLPHAHDVLAALERADAALVGSATELTGSVRLASFPHRDPRAAPAETLAGPARRHPRLRVDLTELEPHESLPALALGRIDVAVAHEYDLIARDAARDLRRAELLREPVLLAERTGTTTQAAARADYAERDWIVPPAATACGELVRRACRAAGFEPRIVAETGDFSVACSLAAAGSASRSSHGSAHSRRPASRSARSTRPSSGASSSPPAPVPTITR